MYVNARKRIWLNIQIYTVVIMTILVQAVDVCSKGSSTYIEYKIHSRSIKNWVT